MMGQISSSLSVDIGLECNQRKVQQKPSLPPLTSPDKSELSFPLRRGLKKLGFSSWFALSFYMSQTKSVLMNYG